MSKSLEEILKEDKLQALNDDKLKRFSLREDKFASNVSRISEAIGKVYSDELADDGQDEYGRCVGIPRKTWRGQERRVRFQGGVKPLW